MKILFVLEHFFPYIGGAEKLFYVLSTALAKEGYEVVVVTTRFDKNLPKEEMHKGVKIVRVDCFNRFGFTMFSLPAILKQIPNCKMVHTTTYNAALPAMLAGKWSGKPVFITFHEVWGDLWKRLPFISFVPKYCFYYFEKLLLRLPFTKFIAVSDFTKNKLLAANIPEDKIIRIYNGIDYDLFKNLKHQAPAIFTYTYFGRLGISKGLNLLIPAVAKFRKKFPKSKLKLIIPKQPKGLYRQLMQLIDKYDLDDYIDFKHNLSREALYQELLTSSCVVIPSYSEGFCFAAAETVALNIPIISSGQGALSEVVSGKFITMDSMEEKSLYEALKKAYNEEWLENPIRYFELEETVKAYKEIY